MTKSNLAYNIYIYTEAKDEHKKWINVKEGCFINSFITYVDYQVNKIEYQLSTPVPSGKGLVNQQ